MRIALFTYSTKPRGGVVHTLALGEHLMDLGHDVHIVALGKDEGGFFRPTRVPHTIIPVRVSEDISLDDRIEAYIETYFQFLVDNPLDDFDVYHAQDCVSGNALWKAEDEGVIASFVRTVHHVDDFTSEALIQCQKDAIYRPARRIVVSRYWQDRLQSEFGVGSEIIYNGVDLSRFRPPTTEQTATARNRYDLRDELAFLQIGGIEPRKNTIRLLEAFVAARARLLEEGKASTLMLVGGETLLDYAPYRDAFYEKLAETGLETGKDIRMLGVVGDDEIPMLYHAADSLVFPSVKEGWGLVVLEAMASGLPVLTSDLPVFREYVKPDENGILVDPTSVTEIANGMHRLATAEPLCSALVKEGFVTADEYGWTRTAKAHVAFYQKTAPAPIDTSPGEPISGSI